MKFLPDYSQLEKALRQQKSLPVLPVAQKMRIRSRLMKASQAPRLVDSFGYGSLVSLLSQCASGVAPQESFKESLREKLAIVTSLDRRFKTSFKGSLILANRYQHKIPLKNLLAQLFAGTAGRRMTASGILSVFVVLMLGNLFVSPNITYAKYETVVEEASGDVLVQRSGTVFPVKPGFVLRENDIIKTLVNSRASVRFLDQSIGRLAENTAVEIASQEVSSHNNAETVVAVVLDYGRLWTRVVNLISDDSSFEVKTASVSAIAKRRAAFDVTVSPDGNARVIAVHNQVDVRVANPKRVVETTLVKGFSANIKLDTTRAVIAPSIKEETDATILGDSQWVTENLTKDAEYIAQVKESSKEAMRQEAGVSPGNPLYALKQLSDSTSVALTLDPIDKNKKLLAIAESKLAQAVVLAEKGDSQGAQIILKEFIDIVASVSQWVASVQQSNPDQANEVSSTLDSLLAQSHKHFSLVLPTDSLYSAKQAVSQAEVIAAQGPVEQTQEKLNNASEKLLDAHDLAQVGNASAVKQQIQEYSETIQDVVNTVKQLDSLKKEQVLGALLDAKREDIKALEAIIAPAPLTLQPTTGTPPQEGSPEAIEQAERKKDSDASIDAANNIEQSVSDVKKEALTQIGEAVLDAQKQLPTPDILQKIEEIRNVDINGKPVIRLDVTPGKLMIRTNTETIQLPADQTRPSAPQVPQTSPTEQSPQASSESVPTTTTTPTTTLPKSN